MKSLLRLLTTVFFLVLFTTVSGLNAEVIPRVWTNFEISAGRDENIYKNYTACSDDTSNLNFLLGSRMVFNPTFSTSLIYRLDYKSFSNYTNEKYISHSVSPSINLQLFDEQLGLNLAGSYDVFNQPEYSLFNFQSLYLSPEMSFNLSDSLVAGLTYLQQRLEYPNFDFDYRMDGASIGFGNEFSIYTILNGNVYRYYKTFPERYFILDTLGILSNDNRNDTNSGIQLTLSQYLLEGQLQISYLYDMLDSNANFLDYGPDNYPLSGNEQLIPDYYDYVSKKYELTYTRPVFKNVYLELGGKYQTTDYTSRIIKNIAGVFLNTTQQDNLNTWFVGVGYTIANLGALGKIRLKIRYESEANQSNYYIFNYQQNIFYVSLQGWL